MDMKIDKGKQIILIISDFFSLFFLSLWQADHQRYRNTLQTDRRNESR